MMGTFWVRVEPAGPSWPGIREGPFVTGGALSRSRQAKPTAQSDLAASRLYVRQAKPAAQRDLAGGRQAEPAAQTDGTAVRGRGAHGKLQSRQIAGDYPIAGRTRRRQARPRRRIPGNRRPGLPLPSEPTKAGLDRKPIRAAAL